MLLKVQALVEMSWLMKKCPFCLLQPFNLPKTSKKALRVTNDDLFVGKKMHFL